MEKTSLLERWKDSKKTDGVSNSIGKAPEGETIPLSHGQRRLWFLQQLYPKNPFYNYTETYSFKGELNVDHLLQALHQVFKSHDILRTVYYTEDGQPLMKTLSEVEISVSQYDLRDTSTSVEKDVDRTVGEILEADARYGFNLSTPPIGLVSIIRTGDDTYRLVLTLHHIATDKWSMSLLQSEWAFYYQELSEGKPIELRPPEVQYPDFAYWQRKREIPQNQMEYWQGKLSGEIPILDLPTDHPRPKEYSFAGRTSGYHHLSEEISKNILRSSKQLGTTPYVYFLSLYYIFLYRYSGQQDILIGSPVSNRDQKSLEKTIGFFNDTVVLRSQLSANDSFARMLQNVKQTFLEAFSNKNVPFDHLVGQLKQERSLTVNPFFQVMFLYHSAVEDSSIGEGLRVEREFHNPGVSKFDLTMYVVEEKGRLSFCFEYATDLFRPETIERFQGHIALLAEAAIEDPERRISEVEMLTSADREFLSTVKSPPIDTFQNFSGIHQCIEKMAAERPNAIAVSFGDSELTYQELDRRAHSLAVRIVGTTLGDNRIVGLCVERSLEMIIGMLAILKAGCAYLPIDPKYPMRRIEMMLEDADIEVLVTQKELEVLFSSSDAVRLLVGQADSTKDVSTEELPVMKRADLAYVIYTSGSTGRPKGVKITHDNILNSTAGRLDFYPENPDVFLLLSSISFDSSKAGIFWTLCTGGQLVVAEDRIEQDMMRLGETIQRRGVTHTLLLPTLYQLLLEHADTPLLESLSTVIVAGEACLQSLRQTHFKTLSDTALYNEYGPTEASVWCIAHKLHRTDPSENVPLGKPVAQAEILLLDADMNRVPIGATGEIYIGGPGLSSGYLNRPDLTEKAFLDYPFSDGVGDKIYKTGDLARYRFDGELEFLGRSDQQIKIRGYRIELEEIEKAIRATVETTQVVVLAEGQGDGPKRIVAYLTAKDTVSKEDLTQSLRKRIPGYMMPSSITQLDALPLLPNGKVDAAALADLRTKEKSDSDRNKKAPATEIETKLHAIWTDLLKQDDIGIHDNFFELGGDSILSIQLIAKARKVGIQLTPNQIFDNQTIAALADYVTVKEKQTEEWDYLVALRRTGSERPLFCIHAGGGHVFFYNVLTKHIVEHRPIYALQASGVYAGKEMHHSIEDMARDYLQAIRSVQPTGPYNIMVYCFSVAVGHEMLIQLQDTGETANLIVMDTMTDPWKLGTGNRLRMRIKSFAKRLVSDPFKTFRGMVGERVIQLKLKLRKRMSQGDDKALARLNDNLARICSVYQWRPHQEKVTLLLTEKPDEGFNKEVIGSWKKVALGGVKVVPVEGNHIDLFAEPEVGIVAKNIEKNCV